MDAGNAEVIQAYAELVTSLSQFKSGMFTLLCITILSLGLGSAFMFFWFRRAMQKDRDRAEAREHQREQEMEAAKQARASLFTHAQIEQAKSLTSLVLTIQATNEATAKLNDSSNRTLSDLGSTVAKTGQALSSVAGVVKRLADKVEGRLSRDDSRRFVGTKLNADMYRGVCNVVERSFNENHYLGREAFIADRVRSRIRDVMVTTRNELKELPLALSVDQFFPTTTDDAGERFTLCDQIWIKVAPLFEDKRPAGDRMDEAALLIENIIKDHLARVLRRDSAAEGESPSEVIRKMSSSQQVPSITR